MASRIGLTEEWVKFIINLKKIRETIGISRELKISPTTILTIQTLTIEEQRKIIKKIGAKQLKQGSELRELVVEIKKLPDDLKTELLTIDSTLDIDMAKTIALFPEQEQRAQFIKEYKTLAKMNESF